ncbi:MAG: hypothetical protein A2X61_05520 [Ignavibacteria bacterium GWB2_35_12]|nr:MAG: hypothetical protein A2X61_05520 [Ignavibacteria bacterium GWB2_35_12]OGU87646.1 MAG: hypothetical protein A2220_12630 [Ignavibacteria bacterium RIFOXYA2_FULL_35_10]OGV24783.1 MAG: hypothetical protein A2475_14330 [Ignavibacteria bacterium RIFOXYC2_FULL_35_21]
MKTKFLILFIFSICLSHLFAKQPLSLSLLNSSDNCDLGTKIWLIDANSDNIYDILIHNGCVNQPVAFSLSINSVNEINENQSAYLTQGSIAAKNFTILIYDTNSFKYTHKLYYDNQISKAILEDYTEQSSDHKTYEEADNYFYTQQMGSTLLITKKAEIDVQSVLLCSLEGKIISHLQNVEGWSQFSFDMSLEPSGMYLLRFIAREKVLTKRVMYVR